MSTISVDNGTLITKPGIYLDMPTGDYFNDPCILPSLTQSTAKILLDRSPKHAWMYHPRLNPNYERHEATKFDIGNAAHSLLLGRGKSLEVVDADDWRTKAAKEARETAELAGKLGILRRHYEQAVKMVAAAHAQIMTTPDVRDAFELGNGEVVIAAEIDGVWLRSMVDWMVDPTHLYDYKTTGMSAAPDRIPYIMADAGWDVQAAIQERIMDALDPDGVGRRKHYFICQETDEPYAITPCLLPESVMNIGRRKLDAAITIWRSCMTAGEWPMYGRKVLSPAYPAYAEARWMERLAQDGDPMESLT